MNNSSIIYEQSPLGHFQPPPPMSPIHLDFSNSSSYNVASSNSVYLSPSSSSVDSYNEQSYSNYYYCNNYPNNNNGVVSSPKNNSNLLGNNYYSDYYNSFNNSSLSYSSLPLVGNGSGMSSLSYEVSPSVNAPEQQDYSDYYPSSYKFNKQREANPSTSPVHAPQQITMYSTATVPSTKIPKKKASSSSGSVSRKHQLPDSAVDILNEWYDDHLTNPYPQLEEKERLAKLGNITVKQVNAWFSNRRNRTQSTKPKRMKREREREIMDIYQELVHNSNKEEIIEKFKQTFSNQQIKF